jgi:nucleoside-diphosphate-sugar epimerase
MSKDRILREIVPRIAADTISINVALALAFIGRFLFYFLTIRTLPESLAFGDLCASYDSSVSMWRISAGVITTISLVIFWFSGFYTFGRAYRSRYKALIILQAVTLVYLVSGILAYLFPRIPLLPRSVFVGGWLLTLFFVGGSRVTQVFLTFVRNESPRTSKSEKDKILVIGGAGYIGSALVKRLLELGHPVRVLDLLVYGDSSISEFHGHPNFELVQGDFRNIHTVVSAVKGVDAIVHLGAIVGDSACSIDQDLTIQVNLRATQTIAQVGKGFGIKRFIFASTCSVYGASDEMLDERSALSPLSLYARTKVESEKVLLGMSDADFAPTILRFGTIYGLSGRPRFDLVVNLLTAKAVQDSEASIFGGNQWRPLVHVRDVAEAIVLTLKAPLSDVRGQVFNVGCNDQNYRIADLGPIIKRMMPNARVVTKPVEDNRNYRVRFDKIQKMLNFQPRYTVRDGMQEIIDAFASGRIVDYRDPRYNNFNFLKQNGELHQLLVEDVGGWDWVKLSADDAMRLAEVVMAVIDSQSQELRSHLRESLVQIILNDVDGFISSLTGLKLPPCTQVRHASMLHT